MTAIGIAVVSIAAVCLALFLAFVPLRLMLGFMSKRVAQPIREFIQRRRDRRSSTRESPDRRAA